LDVGVAKGVEVDVERWMKGRIAEVDRRDECRAMDEGADRRGGSQRRIAEADRRGGCLEVGGGRRKEEEKYCLLLW
jgi:hypothetical protein